MAFRLALSARPTGETGFGLWHTPDPPGGGRSNPPDMDPAGRMPDGSKRQVGLANQVAMVERGLWPTPHGICGDGPRRAGPSGNELGRAVNRSLVPTPSARDWKSGHASDATFGKTARPLNEFVVRYPTPRATDGQKMTSLSRERRAAGREPDSLPEYVRDELGSGSLNPDWVEWLMGFPEGWTDLGR